MNAGEEGLDHLERAGEVDRVDGRIADVGDIADVVGRNARSRMNAANEARGLAHGGRPLPRARPEVDADIERNAYERDVDIRRDIVALGTHECRNPGEA